jgi:hypothetical protein
MTWHVYTKQVVWDAIFSIPDPIDAREVWEILFRLVEDPFQPDAQENRWTYHGQTHTGYSIGLSGGNGFVAYVARYLADGTQMVWLFPLTYDPDF